MMSREAPYTVRRESVAIERTLADVRIILWLTTAAIALPLWITSGARDMGQIAVLGLFLFYSLAMRIIVRHSPRLLPHAVLVSGFGEVLLITALISVCQQRADASVHPVASLWDYWSNYGPSRSPFYLWYVFYVASISLRYGMQMSILGLSASVVLYTIVSVYPPNSRIYSPGFMGDTAFLFILAFLFGHIAERQRSYQTRLAVVNELGVAMASLATSREIIHLLVTQTAGLLGAGKCWFAPHKSEGEEETQSVGIGIDPGDNSELMGEWDPNHILERRQALVSNKPSKDSRLPTEALKLFHIKSLTAAPLYVRDVPVGVLYAADKRPRGFSGYDVELLDLIAAQAAPIIENTQLWERLKEAAASEERLRIARDLHDNFLQTLSAIKLYLERCRLLVDKDPHKALASIERMHEISTEGLADVRSYLSQLRLMGPEPSRFRQAVERSAAEAGTRGGFSVHTEIDAAEDRLTPQLSLAAFQITRELLNNVVKHAQATNAWVSISYSINHLSIVVRDDGVGFDVEDRKRASENGHLGLVGVEERVKELNGEIEMISRSGSGAKTVITIPIPEN